ncbi:MULTISPECIES: 4Fe-4S cluster-binding domain-containing protein [unclassified Micromonospora]|uniref:4Fe-4S cluster-binding domain-containing protein n=1 Tax=unclassified Micromonospora TaxID=2617518 RepID=UPI001C600C1A|nr:4Fe-4S cluster-binding domain-containing protein [Micromonospora sp. RL09-050-HVF-A]MBW4701623.1 4Fe-4S cluster-binding domain-containing protein [Micromonospora sp. RL09-050-HVF-A]
MPTPIAINPRPLSRREAKTRLASLLADRPDLAARLQVVRDMGRRVSATEVHLTTTCNIRCKGCWYFEGGFDAAVPETSDPELISRFVDSLVAKGVTQATLIGGEPTLVLPRVVPFVERLPYVTISTNGIRPLPMVGFEQVAVAISLFGGGPLDDALRGYRVNGSSFSGLFETALGHYRNDPRVIFVYALSEEGLQYVEPTVRAIQDNGNQVTFNFYSAHGSDHALRIENEQRTLAEALRVKQAYPETVVCHPYFIEALITGRTHWDGQFGYDVCPSISVDHPDHAERIRNGNPVLDGFAVYGADYQTLQFCCTSGNCADCRDSQGVYSWLLVSMNRFLDDTGRLETWLELAESYWRQWYWAQRHHTNLARQAPLAA